MAALAALAAAGCAFGPGAPMFPPQAGPDEAFTPVRHCYGVEPDPRFAKRCQSFRRR